MSLIRNARFATLLAVALALVLTGVAAGAAGQALVLGIANNAGSSNTSLTTSSTGNALKVTQNGSGNALRGQSSQAAPLALVGPSDEPPMTLNSSRRVTNLNADKLDGRHAGDFLPAFVYVKAWKVDVPPVDELLNPAIFEVSCDVGDLQLNAGWGGLRPDTQIKDSFPINPFGWHFSVSNLGTETNEVTIELTCADFEPRRANSSHPGG